MNILPDSRHADQCLADAHRYASLGWRIVVLHGVRQAGDRLICTCGKGVDCPSPGKHPRLTDWPTHATIDAEQFVGYWKRWPESNIGGLLGPISGIADVEYDSDEGEATAKRLLANCVTTTYRSHRSTHRLFRFPEGLAIAKAVVKAQGLELRFGTDAKGSQSVFPPSWHAAGVQYRWLDGLSPDDVEPQRFPDALVELMSQADATSPGNGQGDGMTFTMDGDLQSHPGSRQGERYDTLCRLVGRYLAQRGADADLFSLALAWGQRCQPPYPADEVQKVVAGLAGKEMAKRATVQAIQARLPSPEPIECYKPFPLAALPEPLQGFVRAGAKALGCDSAMIALPLLAGVASAIGATRRIRLKATWSEPAVLWTSIVAESGSLKSPAQDLALGALRRMQGWRIEEYEELREQHIRNLLLYDADLKLWKSQGRKKGEPPPEKPTEPTITRYVVNDITIEALADRLRHNPRGLLCDVDELATWICGFDQYRSGKGADVTRWLSIHRAGSLLVDRKGGDSPTLYIRSAAVCVAGSIQPQTLRRVLENKYFENGLAARLLLAAPPSFQKRWTEAIIHPELCQCVDRVFGRLLALDFDIDDNGIAAPVDVPLAPDGKERWVEFYDKHAAAQSNASGAIAAMLSKIEAMAPRIALLSHFVRWASGELIHADAVDAESMETGIALALWFADESERIYGMLGEGEDRQRRRQLVEWIIRRGGKATARDIQRGIRRIESAAEAESALNELAAAGDGQWQENRPTERGGRPFRTFVLLGVDVDTTPKILGGNLGSVDVDSEDTSKTWRV